jgi:protoheme IX farnesyltransferase
MIGGILFEHGHRMIAAFVGFLALVQTLWLIFKESRRWVRLLGIAALLVIIIQGILGGLTVLFLLPDVISIGHAALAEIFFCITVSIAVFTSPSWRASADIRQKPRDLEVQEKRISLRVLTIVTTLTVYFQIILGAFYRHTESGIIFHIVWSLIVTFCVGWLGIKILTEYSYEKKFVKLAVGMFTLLVVQLILGPASFLAKVMTKDFIQPHILKVVLTVAHLALGALLLATSLILTLWVYRYFKSEDSVKDLWRVKVSAYIELTKPRINFLVVLTALIGFFMGCEGPVNSLKLFFTLIGTALVSGGSGVLNQFLERESDSKMKRTVHRPLPSGRLRPEYALLFGIVLAITGIMILAMKVNLLTSFLSSMALVSYLFFYTPLKSRTSLCTLVGAIPGAIPPMMGWAAATNEIGFGAWVLFSILFLWQLPHFLSLARIYREDYAGAGLQMLPVVDHEGRITGQQIILYTLALISASLLPSLGGVAGYLYFFGALILGILFLGLGIRCIFFSRESNLRIYYKSLFHASVIYLPLLLILLVIDKT